MTNIITKIDNQNYRLTTTDGQEFICKTWIEKKKDGKEYEHVIVPKEARELTGRTYIRTSLIGENGYEFETKTEHREGLAGNSWKNRMTPEELAEYERCEQRMNEIKKIASSRIPTEEEKLEAEIARLIAKRESLRAQKN